MNLQEERIEVVEPDELRKDQVAFLNDICERFVLDRFGPKIDKQECMDSSEAERIVALELPGYLQTVCESSKSPTKMVYPVLDAMRLIADKRLHVVSIFMEAYRGAEIGTMRDVTSGQIGSEAPLN